MTDVKVRSGIHTRETSPGDGLEERRGLRPRTYVLLVGLMMLSAVILYRYGVFENFFGLPEESQSPVPQMTAQMQTPPAPPVVPPVAAPAVPVVVAAAVIACQRKLGVRNGETLSGILRAQGITPSSQNLRAVQDASHLKSADVIAQGDEVCIPPGVQIKSPTMVTKAPSKPKTSQEAKVKVTPQPKAQSTKAGEFFWRKVGGAPLNHCGKSLDAVNEAAWTKLGLSDEEKSELRAKMTLSNFGYQYLVPGDRFESVAFCRQGQATFRSNVVAAWTEGKPVVLAEVYTLSSGRVLYRVKNCGNWAIPSMTTTSAVSPPPSPPEPEALPPEASPVLPVHAKEGDTIPCNLQAGAGVYQNRVYQGASGYGEGICYIFKNGEWQHGPGFYVMGGGGESRLSTYSNQETGWGLQYGVQRNWLGDRGPATFELKGRLLRDHMWGSNKEGYWVDQKGYKFGLYSSYYERHGENLVGAIGEYWKSFGSKVKSSWSGQQAQDRGSVGLSGVYEHPLGDSGDWRLRWIFGVQHTNWDRQNWFRLTPEFRFQEWLMFGPQVAVPLGVSKLNQPLSHGDLTTVGAFVRVELGGEIRRADAEKRAEQVEFIPPASAAVAPLLDAE